MQLEMPEVSILIFWHWRAVSEQGLSLYPDLHRGEGPARSAVPEGAFLLWGGPVAKKHGRHSASVLEAALVAASPGWRLMPPDPLGCCLFLAGGDRLFGQVYQILADARLPLVVDRLGDGDEGRVLLFGQRGDGDAMAFDFLE